MANNTTSGHLVLARDQFRKLIHHPEQNRKDFVFEKQIGKYKVIRKVGSGKYGLVKLGEHVKTKKRVAIKIIDKSFLDVVERNSIMTEAEVMTYLHHDHVIQLYEVIENEKEICMIMEFAAGGDLFNFVTASKKNKLREADAKRMFAQIVSGVSYCHRHYIVHRDIKAENIFLDEMNNVKIGDWGFSSEFHPGSKLETYCGSLDYAAPEVLSGISYTGPEVDIWSLGVLLYFMVSGKLPFKDINDYSVYQRIKAGRMHKLPKDVSPECRDLIGRILNPNVQERAKMKDIEQHPWMQVPTLQRPMLRALASSSAISMNWVGELKKDKKQVTPKKKKSISDSKLAASMFKLRYSTTVKEEEKAHTPGPVMKGRERSNTVTNTSPTQSSSANPVTPGGKNNLPKRKTKRSARKRNKTSSSFEAIAEGAEEEPLEQAVEETSRDLESLQSGLKPHNMHSRNRSSSREREFSVLKLSASQLQDFKKLAAFEVLDVHVAAKSPHKDNTSSPRIAPQSPRHVEPLQSPASMPLLPVAIEPSPDTEVVGDDQPLVVVAAKRTNASSIRVLRLFERGGKGMFRSQSDSDLNGATPYSFNNPHYQQGQAAPSHAVTGAKVLVQQRSWNANAFQSTTRSK
jgi:serine/threonine protein kinase